MTGMVLAGFAIALGGVVDSPFLAITSLSFGAGWLYFAVGAYWASTTDLSKAHAGTLSGLMNTGANIGGAISPTLTPWLALLFYTRLDFCGLRTNGCGVWCCRLSRQRGRNRGHCGRAHLVTH